MLEVLWAIPGPATAVHFVKFEALDGRACRLSLSLIALAEDGRDVLQHYRLRFEGVESYRCTYLTSLNIDMIKNAYGRLVDLGRTAWVHELATRSESADVTHLMICFDDGPCYEIACRR